VSALPEPYRKYAAPQGQRPLYPREVELYDETDPIVHVPDPYNPTGFVAVRRSQLQPATPTPPRDLAPQPVIDPLAQRMAGGGILGAGVGWGAAQFLSAVAGAGTGLLAFALLLLAARLVGGRSVVNIHQEVHQHARFGKNQATM
jgi:hypothetical protein